MHPIPFHGPLFAVAALLLLCSAHTQAQMNGALRVDGSDSALHILQHPSLEPADAITVEAWVKGEGSVSNGRILRKGNRDGYMLSWSFQIPRLSGLMDCSGHKVVWDPAPNSDYLGEWHHLAMTSRPSGIIRFYIDGQLVGMESAPACQEHTGDLWFGGYNGVTEEFFGEIDEVRLWSVERTQAEIQASMNLALSSGPGLLSSWHLDGDGADATGENHGTLFGDAVFVPSGAPVGFAIDPPAADWKGGDVVVLSGLYGITDPSPGVLFGGIPSPAVSRVDASTLRVVVPPGRRPGELVAVDVVEAGSAVSSTQGFRYTPWITGPDAVASGAEVEVELLFEAPAQVVIARGQPLSAGVPLADYDWLLEVHRPVVVFSASAPTQTKLTIPVPIPSSPTLIGTPLLFQALIGPALDGKNATFTNAHMMVVTPPDEL